LLKNKYGIIGSSLNVGFNAKTLTMTLPRRQFLPASVFWTSTTAAIPRRHNPPRVVRGNVTSGFRRYLRPPLMMASTKPPNIIWVGAVTTMAPSNHYFIIKTNSTTPNNLTTTPNRPEKASPHPRAPPHPRASSSTDIRCQPARPAHEQHGRDATNLLLSTSRQADRPTKCEAGYIRLLRVRFASKCWEQSGYWFGRDGDGDNQNRNTTIKQGGGIKKKVRSSLLLFFFSSNIFPV
jgi:hypothetical protein